MEMGTSIIIMRDINICVSFFGSSSRENISKSVEDLKNPNIRSI